MLDATNLVEDDKTFIPWNVISLETITDGISKMGDYVLRYNPVRATGTERAKGLDTGSGDPKLIY